MKNIILYTQSVEPFMRESLVDFNLGSRKQIGEYLIDFGWFLKSLHQQVKPIVDEGTIKKIEHIEKLNLIADFLTISKAYSTSHILG